VPPEHFTCLLDRRQKWELSRDLQADARTHTVPSGRKRDRADLNCTILHGRTGDRPGQLLFGFSLVSPFAHPLAREFGSLM
jgi:hypothetical protein